MDFVACKTERGLLAFSFVAALYLSRRSLAKADARRKDFPFIGSYCDPESIRGRYKEILAVVADRQCWTNFHRALGSRSFGIVFRLLEKVNRRFVLIRLQKIGRFLQTGATHRAGHVHVPRSGNVQGLFARLSAMALSI